MTELRGEIYDIGYQHYDGPREGRSRARKALWINGVRTALGLGRGLISKALPAFLFVALIIPAIVFTVIGSLVGAAVDVPGHADYYRITAPILFIFSAIIAPELLTTDRRNGVINLYLVRPLSTNDYIIGRWLAFFTITIVFVYLPQIILTIGLTLGASDPLDYLRDKWLVIPRFLLSGLVVAMFTSILPLAAAAFTTRRAYAAAFVIGLWVISTAVGNAMVSELDGRLGTWSALISFGDVPIFINNMIFNSTSDDPLAEAATNLPRIAIIAWYAVLTAGSAFLLWWRYQRLRA